MGLRDASFKIWFMGFYRGADAGVPGVRGVRGVWD